MLHLLEDCCLTSLVVRMVRLSVGQTSQTCSGHVGLYVDCCTACRMTCTSHNYPEWNLSVWLCCQVFITFFFYQLKPKYKEMSVSLFYFLPPSVVSHISHFLIMEFPRVSFLTLYSNEMNKFLQSNLPRQYIIIMNCANRLGTVSLTNCPGDVSFWNLS